MLFLVIDEMKIDFVQTDTVLSQINMIKETFRLYEEMKTKGKLKISYAFADLPGGITIWDVQSIEELQQILFLLPIMPLVKRTVKPLTEVKSATEVIRQLETLVGSMPK
jgi:muconolactone delta-isomerase